MRNVETDTMMHPADPRKISRRGFLHATVLGAGALTVAGKTSLSLHAGEGPARKPIRLGIIGVGPRGLWLLKILLDQHPDVTIPAICDVDEVRLARAIALVKEKRGNIPAAYSKGDYDYRNLCERDDLEAVLIATPVNWLAPMAIDAMKRGKHVGMEVSGPQTEEECWELVRTREKTGKRLMLLENCSYGDDCLMIYRMVHEGVFGEPYYAEGSYLHDCRSLFFDANGRLTWRGELQRDVYGSNYPQHGLGPCCKWLGINDGDRLVWCQTAMTVPRESHLGAVAQFGAGADAARVVLKQGDFVTTLIGTARGRLIRLDNSLSNTRPYSRYYLLQGTHACWDSRSGIFVGPVNPAKGEADAWSPLGKHRDQYQHSYWRKDGETARRVGGHGGIDYYVIYDFVRMLQEDREPWIDVYDAATWSSIIFCSRLSLDRNGARVEMPDFTAGRWKDPNWRKGRIAQS